MSANQLASRWVRRSAYGAVLAALTFVISPVWLSAQAENSVTSTEAAETLIECKEIKATAKVEGLTQKPSTKEMRGTLEGTVSGCSSKTNPHIKSGAFTGLGTIAKEATCVNIEAKGTGEISWQDGQKSKVSVLIDTAKEPMIKGSITLGLFQGGQLKIDEKPLTSLPEVEKCAKDPNYKLKTFTDTGSGSIVK